MTYQDNEGPVDFVELGNGPVPHELLGGRRVLAEIAGNQLAEAINEYWLLSSRLTIAHGLVEEWQHRHRNVTRTLIASAALNAGLLGVVAWAAWGAR